MEKQKIKDVKIAILDFDGTLVNLKIDWEEIKRNLTHYFKQWDLNINFTPLYPRLLQALKILRKRRSLNEELSNNIKKEAFRIISRGELKSENSFNVVTGAEATIKFLKEDGFKVVILTNNDANLTKKIFKKSKFPRVDAIIGRSGQEHPKFSIGEIKKSLKKISTDRKIYIVIGDNDYDINIGKKIKAATILFCPKASKKFRNISPDFKIKSLLEIRGIVENKKLKI